MTPPSLDQSAELPFVVLVGGGEHVEHLAYAWGVPIGVEFTEQDPSSARLGVAVAHRPRDVVALLDDVVHVER